MISVQKSIHSCSSHTNNERSVLRVKSRKVVRLYACKNVTKSTKSIKPQISSLSEEFFKYVHFNIFGDYSKKIEELQLKLDSFLSEKWLPTCYAICILLLCPQNAALSMDSSKQVSYALDAPSTPQIALRSSKLPPIPTKFSALPELTLPKYTMAKLTNGLKIILLEDHEVPLISGSLAIRGGQYGAPDDKLGVASISAAMLRSGGSTAHSGPELDSILEAKGAGIESGVSTVALSVEFSCIAEDVHEVIGLVGEIIRSPALPEDRLQFHKRGLLDAIEHQDDSPGVLAQRTLRQLLYGKDSLYARTASKETANSITVADVRQYLDTWERPDAAVLGLVGDFESARMMEEVTLAFADWRPAPGQPAKPLPLPSSPIPPERKESELFFVDRPGLTQANVLLGELGISLLDPDMYALDLLASVFNSFGGSIFDEIRSRSGLAYSVSAGWDAPLDHQGLFTAGGATSSPAAFITALRTALASATATPPSEEVLEESKGRTSNTFVFNFASSAAALERIVAYELVGLPQDYIFTYVRGINSVTSEDIVRAASSHFHPERQALVVIGDASALKSSLTSLGLEIKQL